MFRLFLLLIIIVLIIVGIVALYNFFIKEEKMNYYKLFGLIFLLYSLSYSIFNSF